MKTYIVQLEDHDDILSARDKISWSKASRVLLVWPDRARVLDRRVDLLLLLRFAQQLGVQLAVVTPSADVRGYAHELGIPVFSVPEEAQDASWRRLRRRKPAWQQRAALSPGLMRERRLARERERDRSWLERLDSNRWLRLLFFVVGVMAFLALALFFVPGAEVELLPAQTAQRLDIAVWASPEIRSANLTGGMPAYAASAVVEGHDQIESTGRSAIPERAATGYVLLTNLTDRVVEVPAGSIVLTVQAPLVRFETTLAMQVPAGPNQKVQAPVRAVLPGMAGNQPAQAIGAVEGPLGLSVMAENPEPIRGGADQVSPAPSEGDYQALRARLLDALQSTALEELRGKLGAENRLLDGTIQLREVVTEKREPPAGQPADRLQLTLQVEYEAWYVKESDVNAVAQAALDANRGAQDQPVDGSLRVIDLSPPVMDRAESQAAGDGLAAARWQIRAERMLERRWSEAQVIALIRGQAVEEARQSLQANLALAEPPRIRVFPDGWSRLPFLPARIVLVQP